MHVYVRTVCSACIYVCVCLGYMYVCVQGASLCVNMEPEKVIGYPDLSFSTVFS